MQRLFENYHMTKAHPLWMRALSFLLYGYWTQIVVDIYHLKQLIHLYMLFQILIVLHLACSFRSLRFYVYSLEFSNQSPFLLLPLMPAIYSLSVSRSALNKYYFPLQNLFLFALIHLSLL